MYLSPHLSPSGAIGDNWTDEEVCTNLDKMKDGSYLPGNVIPDNPCQYKPSDLPAGIWYFIRLGFQKEGDTGLWKSKGEPCIIYKSPPITGWRTTYKYCDAQGPNEPKTEWVMQEYRITKEKHEKNCSKDAGSLCRVFVSSVAGPSNDTQKQLAVQQNPVTAENLSSYLFAILDEENNRNGQGSTIRYNANNGDGENSRIAAAGGPLNQPVEVLPEIEDGYIEMLDLENPAISSSTSGNTSCRTLDSDIRFDSCALLRDLESEVNIDQLLKHAEFKFSILASVRPTEVVMRPETAGSMTTRNTNNKPAEVNKTDDLPPGSATKKNSHDQTVLKPSFTGENAENDDGGPISKVHGGTVLNPSITDKRSANDGGGPSSSPRTAGASSSGHKSTIVRTKGGVGIGFKKYFCFMQF